jgi:hypothetical protein
MGSYFLASEMGHPISQYQYCKERTYGFFFSLLGSQETVFAELHLVKCADSGNVILVANPNKARLTAKSWADKARAFEKSHPTGLDLPRLIERGVAGALPDLSGAKALLDKK